MAAENTLLTGAGIVCLALGAAFLPGDREPRVAASGLLVLGLALAAWRAGSLPGADLTPPGRLGRGFLVGNAGLLLLGVMLVGVAAVRAPPGPLRLPARLLLVAGVVLLGGVLAAFVGAAGLAGAPAAALMLGLAGLVLTVAVRAMAGGPLRALTRLAPPPLVPAFETGRGATWPFVVLPVAAAASAFGPHVALVFGGLIAASWAAYRGFRPPGDLALPVAPVLTLLLVPAYWLLATIAGSMGLRLAMLPEAPLSPAAELLVSPALLLAAWGTTGLWPFQRQVPGALLAPLGALLLARVAFPLVPGGLEYWRPLAVPLAVLGVWQAAAHGRWPLVLAGAGFLGVVAGAPDGFAAAGLLLAGGLAVELRAGIGALRGVRAVVYAAMWPLAAWAGLRVVEQALRGEVVYTTLGVLGLALFVAAGRERALIPPPGASIFAD